MRSKNIIMPIAIALIVAILAVLLLNPVVGTMVSIDETMSSYEDTAFDYIVVSPSDEQYLDEIATADFVLSTAPCYRTEVEFFTNDKSQSSDNLGIIHLFDVGGADITFFTEDLLVSGEIGDGIVLDETLANKLGVEVGDTVAFTMFEESLELQVDGIIKACTYSYMDSGIAYVAWNEEYAELVEGKIYQYVFIEIDESKQAIASSAYNKYVPMGLLTSEEEYTAGLYDSILRPDDLTDEEWSEKIKASYDAYYETYMTDNYDEYVQNKYTTGANIITRMEEYQKSATWSSILYGFICVLLFAVLNFVTLKSSQGAIEIDIRDGMPMKDLKLPISLWIFISGFLAVVIEFLSLFIMNINSVSFVSSASLTYLIGTVIATIVLIILAMSVVSSLAPSSGSGGGLTLKEEKANNKLISQGQKHIAREQEKKSRAKEKEKMAYEAQIAKEEQARKNNEAKLAQEVEAERMRNEKMANEAQRRINQEKYEEERRANDAIMASQQQSVSQTKTQVSEPTYKSETKKGKSPKGASSFVNKKNNGNFVDMDNGVVKNASQNNNGKIQSKLDNNSGDNNGGNNNGQ